MNVKSFVFLLCPARSGSNLTRAVLSQHPDIFIVPSMALFEDLAPFVSGYGDLGVEAHWRALLGDLANLANAGHVLIPVRIDPEALFQCLHGARRCLGAAVEAVYKAQTEAARKTIGGIKFNNRFEFVPAMMEQMKFTHIIHQRRDPRDVYVSQIRSGTCHMTPQQYAEYWSAGNTFIRQAIARFDGPILELTYEELVKNPDGTVKRIWSFLGVAPFERALSYFLDENEQTHAKRNHMLENLSKPIIHDNVEKFYTEWNLLDAKRYERHLGSELQNSAYAPSKFWKFRSLTRQPEVRSAEDIARHAALHTDRLRLVEQIKARHTQRKPDVS